MEEGFTNVQKYIAMFVFCIIVTGIIYALSSFMDTNFYEDTTVIESVIDSALIECYALEGAYPENIEYLSEYGVRLDFDKYNYFYEYKASNIKPTVKVIIRQLP